MKPLILSLSAILLFSTSLSAAEISHAQTKTSFPNTPVNKPAEHITDTTRVITSASTPFVAAGQTLSQDKPQKQRKVYQEPFLPLSLRTR